MLTYADGLRAIAALPTLDNERIALTGAGGRVLAEDVRLSGDQPPFDRATMDGYALCLGEGIASYRVVGTVPAGSTFAGTLTPGDAVRIMTGAPCPAGTTVVPIELTDRGRERVVISDPAALKPKRNIAWRGEDGRREAVIATLEPGASLWMELSSCAVRTVKDVESYLTRMNRQFSRVGGESSSDATTLLISMGSHKTVQCAMRIQIPLVVVRANVGTIEDKAEELMRILLTHNANKQTLVTYGLEDNRVVLTSAHLLENLDYNELEATLDEMDVTLARALPQLTQYFKKES